jgi:serine/threonine-protein kinase
MSADEFIAERVGQVVGGRWTLDRLLGAGGMAAVYAAHDAGGQVAAVKVLHPEMCVRRDVRERFLREGQAANRINHRGAVRVYEQGSIGDDVVFLVMELLDGETLGERVVRHGTLPVPEVLDVLDQVLDVLVAAHAAGIVHRDLKPDNLFVTTGGQVKVLDFGLARLLDAVPGDFKTRTGAALGTYPYMAPEQALGRSSEIDGRADLFALGATAFRILAQRKVHEAESDAELLMAMASKPAPALDSVAPHVPAPVAAVVDLALAFSRDARYPDARAMQGDVRAVRHGGHPPHAMSRRSVRGAPTSVGMSRPPGSSAVAPTIPDDPLAPSSPFSSQPLSVAAAETTAPMSGAPPVQTSVPPASATVSALASDAEPARSRRRGRLLVVAVLATGFVGLAALVGVAALALNWEQLVGEPAADEQTRASATTGSDDTQSLGPLPALSVATTASAGVAEPGPAANESQGEPVQRAESSQATEPVQRAKHLKPAAPGADDAGESASPEVDESEVPAGDQPPDTADPPSTSVRSTGNAKPPQARGKPEKRGGRGKRKGRGKKDDD